MRLENKISPIPLLFLHSTNSPLPGQTEVKPDTVAPAANIDAEDASDFLARERAALGDDADLFAAPQSAGIATPHGATVADDDDMDLLGGGDDGNDDNNGVFASSAAHTVPIMNNDTADFEASFPAVETETNEVCIALGVV